MKTLISKKLTTQQIDLLKQHNINYDCVPFMSYTLAFDKQEVNHLLSLENATWIFTSKRGVDAIAEPLSKATKPNCILTVGKNAADRLSGLGFEVDLIANTSEDIVHYLKENKTNHPTQQVVYFRGRYYRNTIPAFCKANDIQYEDAECYYAKQNDFEIDLKQYHSIWIFSPINAKIAAGLKGMDLNMKVFSIGPVTSKSLSMAGFINVQTPDEPSFEAVVNLFLSYPKNN